jgi:hypothetical protein
MAKRHSGICFLSIVIALRGSEACGNPQACRMPCMPAMPDTPCTTGEDGCIAVNMCGCCRAGSGTQPVPTPAPTPVPNPTPTRPLTVDQPCYRFCEDGSQPTIDRRSDCPSGTVCQSPHPDRVASDTCSFNAHVCAAQIDERCNADTFKEMFCPRLAADTTGILTAPTYTGVQACDHDASGVGGIMRGVLGRTSYEYQCYTALARGYQGTTIGNSPGPSGAFPRPQRFSIHM